MELTAYFLDFDTPLHVGMEGIGQESVEITVRSDTLWGAIVQSWLLLYDEQPEKICVRSSFRVSSCFPVVAGNIFLPLPVGTLDPLIQTEKNFSRIKKIKKIGYLSYHLFCRVLQGEPLTTEDLEMTFSCWPPLYDEKGNESAQANSLINDDKRQKGCFKTSQRPRLEIDRLYGGAREGQYFFCTDQHFTTDSGLFFFAEFDDKQTRLRFEASLRLLADCGLGADRSVGRGIFKFRKSIVKFPSISKPERFCLLSLFHPTREEVAGGILKQKNAAYTVLRRSGQCGAFGVDRYRRADIWMLADGSVLSTRPIGDIPCVLRKTGPISHDVYRFGVAMALPMAGIAEVP